MAKKPLIVYARQKQEPVSEKKPIFDYTKLISIFPALLILFGVARLSFYYQRFNINIFPLLDFSEIITSFLDVTMIGVYIVVAMALATLIVMPVIGKLKSGAAILFSAFVLATPLIAVSIVKIQLIDELLNTFLIIFYLFILAILLVQTSVKSIVAKGGFYWILVLICALLMSLILSLWFLASAEENSVKNDKKYLGVTIIYKDSTKPFVSDSFNYFIGNTNKYLFIHHEKRQTTTMQKLEDVKSIEFPKYHFIKKPAPLPPTPK
jgi:hypothetical protein